MLTRTGYISLNDIPGLAEPGFHLDTKVAVAADLSDVEVIYEFFVHGERFHPELRLNFAELERSTSGGDRYAIFSDAEDREIAVDVLWGSGSVLWRVALPAGKDERSLWRQFYLAPGTGWNGVSGSLGKLSILGAEQGAILC